jgi:isoquinoline 1-oxidoreductase
MIDPRNLELAIEPERYELRCDPFSEFEFDRRTFFKALGCGVVVMLLADETTAQESGRGDFGGRARRPAEISAWLHVGEDGAVTVFTGKTEVGQNIRTSLAQRVAEELRTPVSSVRLTMSDTGRVPFDMGTFGSRTTPDMGTQLARVAAAAREALIDLAADFFKTSRDTLVADDGKIVRMATGEAVGYGRLTMDQELMTAVTDRVETKPPQQWTKAGTSVAKVDGAAFVTGSHKYASDVKRPGMLHGRVLRPAAFEATLVSVDTSAAESMDGVTVVRNGQFVGVAAPDPLTAERALAAIQAEWTTKSQPSNAEIFDYFKRHASEGGGRGRGGRATGSVAEGLAAADDQIRQTYTIAYIAHVPLEPRAAVAEWSDGRLTVWTGTQRPFGVRGELTQAFGLSDDEVRVIVPDTGSGYGGKHTGEAAVEAARLAKVAGTPVKLVWTREEEFTWGYVRPAGVIDVTAGVRADGTITAWEFHNYNSGASAINPPYEIANQKVVFHSCPSPLRQGSYRGLAATANHFAREVHIDELAERIKMDPLELRLKNLSDQRMRAVLESAAESFGWARGKPARDHGFGIAAGFEKGSYVATCAEVSVDPSARAVHVERVTAAFECGAVINPEHLKNQIEGAIVMGFGGAMFEALEFENGRLLNANFSRYRVPRFRDAPRIEVVLLDRKDLPSVGAGETPIVGIAPAISNAVFHACGVRLRSLPMAWG